MTAACRKHAGSDGAKKLLALPFAFLLLPYHGSDRPLTQAVLTVPSAHADGTDWRRTGRSRSQVLTGGGEGVRHSAARKQRVWLNKSMSKNVGIGIIGTGFARTTQIPAFQRVEGAFIASVASHSLENARATAAACGAEHFTSDWCETVAHPQVDLVCITTPPIYHREMTLAALANNKHVLCEKPMAMNAAEAEEMCAAARGREVLALIDHELRFQDGRQKAFKMLRQGRIGKIRHVKAFFRAPHRGDPNVAWNWWSDVDSGGGALGAIGSHVIDSFNWLLGTPISRIFCQLEAQIKTRVDKNGDDRKVTSDDEVNLILRFADSPLTQDTTGVVSLSMTEGPSYKNILELHGTDGAMKIDANGGVSIALRGEKRWEMVDTDAGETIEGIADTGFARGFVSFAPRIIEAIREGRTAIEYAATFEDGLAVQRVIDAAHESNASGNSVAI